MEIKQFIQTYNQSYSRNDTVFNSNQLQYLRLYGIDKINLRKNKELFNIYFDYNYIKCALFFIELKDGKYFFEFKDHGDPDKTFKYIIEVEKVNSFDIIRKAIEYSMLKLIFENFKI